MPWKRLFNKTNTEAEEKESVCDSSTIKIREEQLDITKKRIPLGEVTIRKEVFTEEKNITVPVTREELVIENKIPCLDAKSRTGERTEVIRIPVSEEHVEVIKHSVVLEDVRTYTNQFEEIERIEELIKKEKLNVKTTGEPKVVYNDEL